MSPQNPVACHMSDFKASAHVTFTLRHSFWKYKSMSLLNVKGSFCQSLDDRVSSNGFESLSWNPDIFREIYMHYT